MVTRTRGLFLALVPAMILGILQAKTSAQCVGVLPGLGSIDSVPGNPFRAEVQQTFLSESPPIGRVIEPRHGSVARDSEARIRTEWSNGQFKMQTAPVREPRKNRTT